MNVGLRYIINDIEHLLIYTLPIYCIAIIIIGFLLPRCKKDDEDKKKINNLKLSLIITGFITLFIYIAYFVYTYNKFKNN